jgi:hypothetical protein
MKNYLPLIVVLGSISLSGCELLQEPKMPFWDMEVLGPLTRSELKLSDISSSLPALEYKTEIRIAQIFPTLTPGTAYPSIPATSGINVGPFTTESSDFGSVTLESGEVVITIQNDMPVDVKNVTLEVRSEGQEIITYNLTDLASKSQKVSSPLSLAGKKLGKALEISLKDLSTSAKNAPGVVTSNDGLKIEITFNELKFSQIELKGNRSLSVEDESPVNFVTDEIGTISITGNINFLATNGLAMETKVQIYFLNENGNKIDSLFNGGSNTISAAKLDVNGRPTEAQKTTLTTEFGKDRYEMLKGAKAMKTEAKISVPQGVSSAIISKDDALLLQTVGDFIIRISKKK